MASDWEDVVAELQAKLAMKEKECKRLKEENENLQIRMQELEGRMQGEIRSSEERMEEKMKRQIEEHMEQQMEEKMGDMMRQLAGMEGAGVSEGVKTSTPLLGKEWLLKPVKNGKQEKVKDGEEGSKKEEEKFKETEA